MVFAERYRRRRFQEERQKGRQEGIEEERRAWVAWNERRMQAEANGQLFHEAPPSQKQPNSDSNGKIPDCPPALRPTHPTLDAPQPPPQ